MASYNFTSQLQGPVVPINLYSENATAGINAGNALGTPVSAAINGVIKGVQTGQEIVQKDQQITATDQENQIRANQISQLPTANRIQDAQATTQEAAAKVASLRADNDAATQQLALQDQQAQLENDAQKLQASIKLRDQQAKFSSIYGSATPQLKQQILFGGQYTDLFAAKPEIQRQAVIGLLNTPNNGLTPEQSQNLAKQVKFSQVTDEFDKARARAIAPGGKAAVAYGEFKTEDATTNQMATKMGILPDQITSNVQLFPTGKYSVNSDTGMYLKDASGNYIPQKDFEQVVGYKSTKGYDAVDSNGLIIQQGITNEYAKKFDHYKAQLPVIDGTYKRTALSQASQGSAPKAAGPAAAPSLVTQKKEVDPAPGVAPVTQQGLSVAPEIIAKATPEFANYTTSLATLLDVKTNSDKAATLSQVHFDQTTIAKTISDHEFDSSPAIQALSGPQQIAAYNRSIYSQFGVKEGEEQYLIPETDKARNLTPLLASGPKDLYYRLRGPVIEAQLKKQQTVIEQAARDRDAQAAKAQLSKEAVIKRFGTLSNARQ